MSWFVVAYIVFVFALGVHGFYDDRRAGRSVPYLAVDAAVTALWIYFVVAYFFPRVATPLGRTVLPLMLGALWWTASDAWREIRLLPAQRAASYDPELSARWNLWIDRVVEGAAVVMGVLAIAPAVLCAVLVILRSW